MIKTNKKSIKTKKRSTSSTVRSNKSQKVAIKKRIKRSRQVHKRILLNPLTVLMLLCVLVFLVAWTYKAVADTTISAEIYAQPLTQGAIITEPINGTTLSTQTPITVNGTCPDSSYVKIYANGIFKGVSLCSSGHTFQVQVSLFNGDNTVLAQDFNVTDQAGPVTPSVLVILPAASSTNIPNQSGTQTSTSVSSVTNPTAVTPLLLTSNFQWQTFSTNSKYSWKIDLAGGYPPYSVGVDWGDGSSSYYKFDTDPTFNISHSYTKPGYYLIKVSSTDSKSDKQTIQLAALINLPNANSNFFGPTAKPTTTAKSSSITSFFNSSKNWLWIAWPSLIIVLLMMFSFWLGELQDRRALLYKKRLSRS